MPPAVRVIVELSMRDGKFFVRFSIKQQILEIATCSLAHDLKDFFIGSKVVDKHTMQVTPEVAQRISRRANAPDKYGPICKLDESVQSLSFIELSDQIQIRVFFDPREHKPCFGLPDGAHWLSEEAFLHGQAVYFLPDYRLGKIMFSKKIKEEDFAYILEQKDEPWLNMEMKLDSQKLYEIKIANTPNNRFELRLVWLYPRNTWLWSSGSRKYIVVNQHVHEVPAEVSSNQLLQIFPKNDTRIVTREELTQLYNRFRSILSPFIDASLRAVVAPCWFADELQLRYQSCAREEKGRRAGYAVASLVVGDEIYDARQLSEQIVGRELTFQGRRLNLDTLLAVGIGPFGYFSDGRPLEPAALVHEDIFDRTFIDAANKEHRLHLEEGLWLEKGTPRELLTAHLNYLLHFGISGGAVLGSISGETLIDQFILDYLASPERRGKTLVVMHNNHLTGLKGMNYPSEVQVLRGDKNDLPISFDLPVHLISYELLEKYPELVHQKWDLVIFMEPEKQFKRASALHTKACSLQSPMYFAIISGTLRSMSANSQRLVTKLLRWRTYRNQKHDHYLMRLLLPDSNSATPQRRVRPSDFIRSSLFKMFRSQGNNEKHDEEETLFSDGERRRFFGNFATVRLIRESSQQYYKVLLKSLRRMISERPRPCRYFPFRLDDSSTIRLGQEQSGWFLYWRSEFRKGNYLESDEGYLFLMLIEIANGLSFKDRETGWKMLLHLEANYSGISQKMDDAITYVMLDYAIFFGNEHIWRDLPNIPRLQRYEFIGNLRLQLRAIEEKQIINLDEIFLYVNFDFQYVCRQCLSLNPSKEEIEEFLVLLQRVVDRLQSEVLAQTGQSVFRFLAPSGFHVLEGGIFKGIPYSVDEGFELKYQAWTRHKPLSDFWLAIFKEAGNRYRRTKKIRGQLKVGTIGEFYLEVIDSILPRQSGKKSGVAAAHALQPKPLELSRELLDRLRVEAEEVQHALETAVDGEDSERTQKADVWTSSFPTASGGLGFGAANEPWRDFVMQLQAGQREALLFLLSGRKDAQALQNLAARHGTMPDLLLDDINELFMGIFGDLLVETDTAMPDISAEYRDALSNHIKRS